MPGISFESVITSTIAHYNSAYHLSSAIYFVKTLIQTGGNEMSLINSILGSHKKYIIHTNSSSKKSTVII